MLMTKTFRKWIVDRSTARDFTVIVFYSAFLSLYEEKAIWLEHTYIYRTRAIITRGLYTFYPLFEVHLCTLTFGLMYG